MSGADHGRQPQRLSRRWQLAFGAGTLAVLLGVAVYLGVEKPWLHDAKQSTGDGAASSDVIKAQAVLDGAAPAAVSPTTSKPTTTTTTTTATPSKTDGSSSNDPSLITGPFGLGGKQAVLGGLGTSVCNVDTEAALRAAVDGGACTFLLLTRSEYRLTAPLIITRPVIILGSPLTNPLIDGEDITRSFHVLAGGALELRSLRTYPGQGEEVDIGGRTVLLRVGTLARVELGGSLNMYGVTLEQSPRTSTAEYFITQLRRSLTQPRITLGGYIFVAGGVFNMVGCTTFRFAPYGNPNPTDLSLGRDILVLFGTASLVGVSYVSIQFWHVKLTVGGIIAVLGGTLGVYGFNIVTITGFNNQFGAGMQTFIGGGNAIHIGLQRVSFSLSTVRGGYGLFANGGGTFVATGASQVSASLVRAEWGTGPYSNGAGVMTLVAIQTYSCHNNAAVYGAGFHYFNGGGTFVLISGVRSNNGLTTFQSGTGFHIATNGITSVISASSYTSALCRYQEGLGTDTYMGGGFVSWYRVYRFRIIGFGTFIGLGNQIFIAAGAGAFIDNFQDAYIIAEWRSNAIINPTTGALQNIVYTVNGAGATRGQANTDIFMSVPRPGNPTGRQPIPGFPANIRRRGLAGEGNSTDADLRSLLLVENTHVYETQVPLEAGGVATGGFDPLNPLASIFDAYAAVAEEATGERPNQLAISTNDTDCLVCGVPAEQLFGSSPCVVSECPGNTLRERTLALFANAPAQVPDRLITFASETGLLPTVASRGRRRHRARELSAEQKEEAAKVKITQLEHKTTIYCRSEDGGAVTGCGNADAFKAALVSTLAEGLSISVHEEKVRTELAAFFPEGQLDRLHQSFEPESHASGCEGWSTFISLVTTRSADELQRAEEAWAAATADSTALLAALSSEIGDDDGLALCAAVVVDQGSKPVPSSPVEVNQRFLSGGADLLGSAWPSVSLTGDGTYGYATRVSHGQDYTIHLSGFAALTSVKVELVDARTGSAIKTVTTVNTFPAKGGAKLVWRLPADAITGEEYVLRATGASPQKDDSPRFLVV